MNQVIENTIDSSTPLKKLVKLGLRFALRQDVQTVKAIIKRGGCGMDMGFDLVHSLSYLVSDNKDGYWFKQGWL